ncbi:immunity 26 domain-containing protein [Pseudomonas syringae pv. theae]|uniref:Imm26 family immunity protein n=1 Tax=Pseudomonas syringae TaxID=317 RepID=UPI0023C2E6FF|nr:Imm26 family immunity protein [Pseudomonas syringae]GKS08953.1 immunity 26 domain-containing protein [Pseudomonas syringae pv. theae]
MKIKPYSWDKKAKTMLRSIKSGDIFCFYLNGKYRFGRIMTRNRLGHVAEIFEHVSDSPDASTIESIGRVGCPVILDSYGLFDRKIEGDWRIIGHQEDYAPPQDEPMVFTMGIGEGCKKVDIFDNVTSIAEVEAKKLKNYSPLGESRVIDELGLK